MRSLRISSPALLLPWVWSPKPHSATPRKPTVHTATAWRGPRPSLPSLGTARAHDCAQRRPLQRLSREPGRVARPSRLGTCSRGQVSRSRVCGLKVKAASGFPRSGPAGAPRSAPSAPLPCGAGALAKRCLPTGGYELLGCMFKITFLAIISFDFMRVLQYFYTSKKSNLLFPVAFPTT